MEWMDLTHPSQLPNFGFSFSNFFYSWNIYCDIPLRLYISLDQDSNIANSAWGFYSFPSDFIYSRVRIIRVRVAPLYPRAPTVNRYNRKWIPIISKALITYKAKKEANISSLSD